MRGKNIDPPHRMPLGWVDSIPLPDPLPEQRCPVVLCVVFLLDRRVLPFRHNSPTSLSPALIQWVLANGNGFKYTRGKKGGGERKSQLTKCTHLTSHHLTSPTATHHQKDDLREGDHRVTRTHRWIKDQRSKIKDQRSKIKDQRSKIKDQRSKIKDQRSKIKDQRSKIKDQRSKIKDQRSKIKDQTPNTTSFLTTLHPTTPPHPPNSLTSTPPATIDYGRLSLSSHSCCTNHRGLPSKHHLWWHNVCTLDAPDQTLPTTQMLQ